MILAWAVRFLGATPTAGQSMDWSTVQLRKCNVLGALGLRGGTRGEAVFDALVSHAAT